LSNKPKVSQAKQLLQLDDSEKVLPKWVDKLKKYNITTEMIETNLLKKYEPQYIEESLKYCENYFNQSNVKNQA
jgi:hypothetical protein